MKNLTSIAKHSDWLENKGDLNDSQKWQLHRQRVEFGKQPLEIWQFVPCKLVDGVWVVLEEPHRNEQDTWLWAEYKQAKERCLFEGFKKVVRNDVNLILHSGFCLIEYNLGHFGFYDKSKSIKTIEDLVKYNLELTPTA